MSWVAVGVGGAALAGSVFGGVMGAAGAQKQAGAIKEAANIASQTALNLYGQAKESLAPFRGYGIQAGDQLTNLLFGGGDVSAVTKASPLFQFQSEMGSRNINRELAARGMWNSGAGLETLQRFNNQLVGEEADKMYGRLFNLTQLGQNAAAQTASSATATGNNASQIQMQAGMAQGGAIANQYNAVGSAIQGGFNAIGGGLSTYAQYQMYQPLLNRLAGSGNILGGGANVGGNLTQFSAGGKPFLVNTPGGGTSTFASGY